MSNWTQINTANNKFRLLCNHPQCTLSLANLENGKISITTLHGNSRHSIQFDDADMAFIVSQYITSLSVKRKQQLVDFLNKI